MPYKLKTGIEVHAQLAIKSKLFCSCSSSFGQAPNTQICPICLGYPGALPVLNQEAVRMTVMLGLALNGKIHTSSWFERKNYIYPDLPKAYQITQHTAPLVSEAYLDTMEGRVYLQSIHLEEDSAKIIRDSNHSGLLIDFNRSGVALVEIVSKPELYSSSQVDAFLKKLRTILLGLGLSSGKMEEGALRFDVNVSVSRLEDIPGEKVEIKNLNSFRFVREAIEYEHSRQGQILSEGGQILSETRAYDEKTRQTKVLRRKNPAMEYRYFPEPDLGILRLSSDEINDLRDQILPLLNEISERRPADGSNL